MKNGTITIKEYLGVVYMKTLSYVLGREEEIKINENYYFGQLWDGDGDGEELLESGAISPDNENVAAFEIVEKAEDICKSIVKITDIY